MEPAPPVISGTRATPELDERYNTEGARVFFGPVQTPELKLNVEKDLPFSLPLPGISMDQSSDIVAARESPQPNSAQTEEEMVEDLVQPMIGGDDETDSLDDDTKDDNMDDLPNEPSFILAERISAASGNPSPPPSPLRLAPVNLFNDLGHLQMSSSNESQGHEDRPPLTDAAPVSQNKQLSAPSLTATEDVSPIDVASTTDGASIQPSDMASSPSHPMTSSEQKRPAQGVDSSLMADPPSSADMDVTPVGEPMCISSPAPLESSLAQPELSVHASPTHSLMVDDLTTTTAEGDSLIPPRPSTPPLRRSPRRSGLPTPSQPPRFTVPTLAPQSSPRRIRRKQAGEDARAGIPEEEIANRVHPKPTILTTPEDQQRTRSRSPLIFNREVGSLSPKTEDLLRQLLPTSNTSNGTVATGETNAPVAVPVFRPPSADIGPSTPQRVLVRPMVDASPSKPFNHSQPSHVPETPARRITMQEAIDKGQISPVKAAQMGYTPSIAVGTSGSAIPATPARRVLVTDKNAPVPSSSRTTLRFGSPIRPSQGAPTHDSTKPIAPTPKPDSSRTPRGPAGGRIAKLPFPLTAAKPTASSAAKTLGKGGTSEPTVRAVTPHSSSSPTKSSALKVSTSRIPRVPSKPYIRPAAGSKTAATKTPLVERPVAMRKVDLSKPSSSRMVQSGRAITPDPAPVASAAKGKGKAAATTNGRVAPAASDKAAVLKRKRPDPDALQASSSPPSSTTKPKTAIRLVPTILPPQVPGTGSKPMVKKDTPSVASNTRPTRTREPPSRTSTLAAKEKEKEAAATAAAALSTATETPPVSSELAINDNATEYMAAAVPESLGSPMQAEPPEIPTLEVQAPQPVQPRAEGSSLINQQQELRTPPTIVIESAPQDTPPIETLPPFIQVPAETLASNVRRTSRLRKSTPSSSQTSTGVNGTSENGSTPPAKPSRRKQSAQNYRFTFTDAYQEMSATALKNLTAANTVRNQAYLSVNLETEIVRKNGARPESPAVKIKTIAQREDEIKQRGKLARAQRYARRTGSEIPGSSDLEADSSEDDELPQIGSGGGRDPLAPRHQRGAGEDEDYQTPHRAFKRMKLSEDEDGSSDEKRRVQWDRGLFTVIFLDEIKLGSRAYRKTPPKVKGCLTPAAKSLPLDTLGNLPDDKPVLPPNSSPEQVIVKKFVYESDIVEPEPEPTPPPKVTRSKKKSAVKS